jgi:hypothetical protein
MRLVGRNVLVEFARRTRRPQGRGEAGPSSAFVAKLQRAGNRSAAGRAVDKAVNMRWNVRE